MIKGNIIIMIIMIENIMTVIGNMVTMLKRMVMQIHIGPLKKVERTKMGC